ncbi:MAG: GDSL-type esterase/lipase family protein [Anaerolineae bacterium]
MQARRPLLLVGLGLIAWLAYLIWRVLHTLLSDDPAVWAGDIAKFIKADRRNPPPEGVIVFTGSSSITFWSTLERDMAPLPVLNRGFGGARINQVAYYADQIVIPYRPRAVVLFAGTNDIAWPKPKPAQEVYAGYLEFVNKVHSALPDVPIYYVGITPAPSRRQYWPIVQEANRLIQAHTRTDPRLHYIDLTDKLSLPNGEPNTKLYRIDKLHPNTAGYAVWTSVIKPILETHLFWR